MRVLLVEDDAAAARSVELMLRADGIDVTIADLGEDGIDRARLHDHDLIALDLDLPDMTGFEVLKTLRDSRVATPVLILSGTSEPEAKVRALGFGADDYVTKPFNRDELVARIRAIVRRSKGYAQSIVRIGKLAVNLEARAVDVGGVRISLTGKEQAVLELFVLHKGSMLTKEMIFDHLYGVAEDRPEPKIIDVFISKLRKKLSLACGGENYIETVWGHGYVLRNVAEDPPAQVA